MGKETAISWTDSTIRKRFDAKYIKGKPDDCWPWMAAKLESGYGVIYFQGKQTTAHRVAYILNFGWLSSDLVVDHICRNRGCVNPNHLEAVTTRENILRGLKGRMKTHCEQGHAFTEISTGITKQGRRFCILCRRIRDSKRPRDAAFWRNYRLKRKVNHGY